MLCYKAYYRELSEELGQAGKSRHGEWGLLSPDGEEQMVRFRNQCGVGPPHICLGTWSHISCPVMSRVVLATPWT